MHLINLVDVREIILGEKTGPLEALFCVMDEVGPYLEKL